MDVLKKANKYYFSSHEPDSVFGDLHCNEMRGKNRMLKKEIKTTHREIKDR